MSDIALSKSLVRNALLDRRKRLTQCNLEKAAEDVVQPLLALEEIYKALHIGLYWSYRKEIPTHGIFRELKARGKKLYLPRVVQDLGTVEFVKIDDEKQLVQGAFGIGEPSLDLSPCHLEEIQTLIIPGVAFDVRGHRIGWGLGMYDKLLAKYSGRKIGLAFDFQVLESIPYNKYDQRVHRIVTDYRVIRCSYFS